MPLLVSSSELFLPQKMSAMQRLEVFQHISIQQCSFGVETSLTVQADL